MLNTVRRWHWNLLHRVFGLPERDHRVGNASLSEVLHSHPPVPAHHRPHPRPHGHTPNAQAQLERELQREPRILKNWQRSIGAMFAREASTPTRGE